MTNNEKELHKINIRIIYKKGLKSCFEEKCDHKIICTSFEGCLGFADKFAHFINQCIENPGFLPPGSAKRSFEDFYNNRNEQNPCKIIASQQKVYSTVIEGLKKIDEIIEKLGCVHLSKPEDN